MVDTASFFAPNYPHFNLADAELATTADDKYTISIRFAGHFGQLYTSPSDLEHFINSANEFLRSLMREQEA